MATTRGYCQNSKKVFRVEIRIKCKQTLSKKILSKVRGNRVGKATGAQNKEYSMVTLDADPQVIRMFIDLFREESRPKWGS